MVGRGDRLQKVEVADGGGDARGAAVGNSVDGGYVRGKSVPPAALAVEVQWRLRSPLAVGLAAMRISMVESAEREGGWNEQDKGGGRPAAAARREYLMVQRAVFPVGSAKWYRHVLGEDCATGAADIWRPGGEIRPGRVSEWPLVEGWQCYQSKRWVTAPPTDVDGRCPCTCDRCASSGLHRPSMPSAESEVVRQWVATLVPPQAGSGALEEQLCGAGAGMRWRGYCMRRDGAGPMLQLHGCVRLRQRAELGGFRSRLIHTRQSR